MTKTSNKYSIIVVQCKDVSVYNLISKTSNWYGTCIGSKNINLDIEKVSTMLGYDVTPNTVISADEIKYIADKEGWSYVYNGKFYYNHYLCQEERLPVVTIFGHVDHGKTTLLDALNGSKVTKTEKGGITQMLSTYNCQYKDQSFIVIDTPGHKSFKSMRNATRNIIDIALLVIALDDGIQPQTVESIEFIRDNSIEFIVVFTKEDKSEHSPSAIINSMSERYNLHCEDYVVISALLGKNIHKLVEHIMLKAKSHKYVYNSQTNAYGYMLEHQLTKSLGYSTSASVRNGVLHTGEIVYDLDNLQYSSVKLKNTKYISPNEYGNIYAFNVTQYNEYGTRFIGLPDIKSAKKLHDMLCPGKVQSASYQHEDNKQFSLEDLIGQSSDDNEKNVIIKTDSYGGLAAVEILLSDISKSDKISKIAVLYKRIGHVSKQDLEIAKGPTKASIIYFGQGHSLYKDDKAVIASDHVYTLEQKIIKSPHFVTDNIIAPQITASATVVAVFGTKKKIAGCRVNSGVFFVDDKITVRDAVQDTIHNNTSIISLRQQKNTVAKTSCGMNFGFSIKDYTEPIIGHEIIKFES